MGRGNSATQPQQIYQSTTNLPAYAEPYMRELLEGARALALTRSAGVPGEGGPAENRDIFAPYTPYPDQRVVDIAGLHLFPEYIGGVVDSSALTPSYLNIGVADPRIAFEETQNAIDLGKYRGFFQPGEISSSYQPYEYQPSAYEVEGLQAPGVTTPYQGDVSTIESERIQTPGLAGLERVGSGDIGYQSWTAPGEAGRYISPYQRQVIDVERQQAQRAFDEQRAARNAAAVRAGAFGGSRQAVGEAEAERGLQSQLAEIEARGGQRAWDQAQAQFERDRAASLQAQQFNVGSGLRAALANQAAGLTAGTTEAQLSLEAQRANQMGSLQAFIANQRAMEEAAARNQAAELQTQALGAGQTLEAQTANQRAALELARLQEQSGQFGAEYAGAGERTRAQMELEAQQASERARQEAENIFLRGGELTLSGARQLAGLRDLEQQLATRRTAALRDYLALQTEQEQRGLDYAFQEYQMKRDYPQYLLSLYSNILRGMPITPSTNYAVYEPPPNPFATAAGLGLTALGLRR